MFISVESNTCFILLLECDMHVRHCLGHLNIVIWWVRLHPTFLDSVSGQDLYEVHEYRLTINTRIECIYVCDHECVCVCVRNPLQKVPSFMHCAGTDFIYYNSIQNVSCACSGGGIGNFYSCWIANSHATQSCRH